MPLTIILLIYLKQDFKKWLGALSKFSTWSENWGVYFENPIGKPNVVRCLVVSEGVVREDKLSRLFALEFFFSVCKIFHQASPQLCTPAIHPLFQWSHIKTNRILIYVNIRISHKKAWQPLTAFIYLFLFWEEFKRDEIIRFPPLKHFTALWIWRNKDTTFRNWVTWEIFFFFFKCHKPYAAKKVTLTELIEN